MLAIAYNGYSGGYGFGVAPETCDPNTEFFDRDTQTCKKFDSAGPSTAPIVPTATATPITTPAAAAAAAKTSIFKKPLFWVAVLGGIAVVGGGAYMLKRRRKSA